MSLAKEAWAQRRGEAGRPSAPSAALRTEAGRRTKSTYNSTLGTDHGERTAWGGDEAEVTGDASGEMLAGGLPRHPLDTVAGFMDPFALYF